MSNDSTLTPDLREGIARMLDPVVPGTDRMPSGRSVDAQGDLIDRVLDADPRLVDLVVYCAKRATERETCTLDDLREWAGDDVERLVFALHAAYYMSREVRDSLGYAGQRRLPVSEATPDQIGTDEIIEPVIARGSIYIPTPDPKG